MPLANCTPAMHDRSHRLTTRPSHPRETAFTTIELLVVVLVLAVLFAAAMPNYLQARETTQRETCLANLARIDAAKQQWALEYGAISESEPEEADLEPYLGGSLFPECLGPDDYTIGKISDAPTCAHADLGHVLETDDESAEPQPGPGGSGNGSGGGPPKDKDKDKDKDRGHGRN